MSNSKSVSDAEYWLWRDSTCHAAYQRYGADSILDQLSQVNDTAQHLQNLAEACAMDDTASISDVETAGATLRQQVQGHLEAADYAGRQLWRMLRLLRALESSLVRRLDDRLAVEDVLGEA